MVYVGTLAFPYIIWKERFRHKKVRKDSGRLWTVARVTTRKQKMDESAYLHCILKFREESENFLS